MNSKLNKAAFHNKVLMVQTELSLPPPLKPSHCGLPPPHNSPFVSQAAAYLSSAAPQRRAPFGSGDGNVSVTQSEGQ